MTAALLEHPQHFSLPTNSNQGRDGVVVLDGLTFSYPGFRLGPLSFALRAGARCALVGRNGAGKTTLLNLLSGLRAADAGTGSVCGHRLGAERLAIREDVALTGDDVRGCGWMTVREHFALLAKFFDRWRPEAALDLARRLDVPIDAKLAGLSRGTGVKVALCSAWGQGAKLLLLDEPTAGLDPIARVEFLRELEGVLTNMPDVSVIIATHILEDLDHLSVTDLLILRNGTGEHIAPEPAIPAGRGGATVRRILGLEARGEL